MVLCALSDDHMIQLKVVTGTLNPEKNQDEILESGLRSPLGSLDGQNMVTLQDLTVLTSSRYTKINRTSQVFHELEPFQTRVRQAQLMCLKLGTSRIKTIVNFARLYCKSGTGFHVLNACTQ